jgi:hypothetical protein
VQHSATSASRALGPQPDGKGAPPWLPKHAPTHAKPRDCRSLWLNSGDPWPWWQHAFQPRRARNGASERRLHHPRAQTIPPDQLTQTRGTWRTWLTGSPFIRCDNKSREEDDGKLAAMAVVLALERLKRIVDGVVRLCARGIERRASNGDEFCY